VVVLQYLLQAGLVLAVGFLLVAEVVLVGLGRVPELL
jgi:hypothetical protein